MKILVPILAAVERCRTQWKGCYFLQRSLAAKIGTTLQVCYFVTYSVVCCLVVSHIDRLITAPQRLRLVSLSLLKYTRPK